MLAAMYVREGLHDACVGTEAYAPLLSYSIFRVFML